MLPSTASAEIIIETLPSKDYRMDIKNTVISGYCDSIEAMKQVIFNILNTERYQSMIYSWNYGLETVDLYGKSTAYCIPELKRRIEEALLQDDRINSVDEFEFDTTNKKIIHVTFTVHTVFGDVETEKAVNI